MLIVSNHDKEAYLETAINLGDRGYLLKNEDPDTIAKANGSVMQLQKAVTGNDGDFRDCPWFNCHTIWRNSGVEIVTWDKSIYGDTMVYDWIERDTGNSLEVSVDISTKINGITVNATAKRTITDNDDILRSSAVEYCDAANGEGYLYNTGYLSFYVRQR